MYDTSIYEWEGIMVESFNFQFRYFQFFSCSSCWIDLLKNMSTSTFSCLTFQILCRTCHISCRPDVDALFPSVYIVFVHVRHFFVHVDTQNVTSYSCQCDRTQVNVTYLKYGSLTPSTCGTEVEKESLAFWGECDESNKMIWLETTTVNFFFQCTF